MQIEETFRDTKNHRFGWSLGDVRLSTPQRTAVLLTLAALAFGRASFPLPAERGAQRCSLDLSALAAEQGGGEGPRPLAEAGDGGFEVDVAGVDSPGRARTCCAPSGSRWRGRACGRASGRPRPSRRRRSSRRSSAAAASGSTCARRSKSLAAEGQAPQRRHASRGGSDPACRRRRSCRPRPSVSPRASAACRAACASAPRPCPGAALVSSRDQLAHDAGRVVDAARADQRVGQLLAPRDLLRVERHQPLEVRQRRRRVRRAGRA